MPALPVLKASEVIRALERAGWSQVKARGGHRQFTHPQKAGRITIPFHGNRDIEPWLLRRILGQAGLKVEEFLTLL